MPYDDGLAHRLRQRLDATPGVTEQALFGGLGFMVDGNLACGVIDDAMVVRVGPEAYDDALGEPHARPFDFTGREMRGWVFVDPPGLSEDEALDAWIERAMSFVRTLPSK